MMKLDGAVALLAASRTAMKKLKGERDTEFVKRIVSEYMVAAADMSGLVRSPKHPNQPLVFDDHGVIRFKENGIISWMLDQGRERGIFDMNKIGMHYASNAFTREDMNQLAQLIGYSVSGYGDLSYANVKTVHEADLEAERMLARRKRK